LRVLKIHKDASADLEAIRRDHPGVAAAIGAFLDEAKASQELLDTFTATAHQGGYVTDRYKIRPWVEQQKLGRRLYSLNLWSLEDVGHIYRVIYAFGPPESHFILAVARHVTSDPEDFDYRATDAITIRVVEVYDRLSAAGRL
jgi:hypothetical protein